MSRPLRVLIVEDNSADAELIVLQLRRAGFAPEWSRVDTELEYLARCPDRDNAATRDSEGLGGGSGFIRGKDARVVDDRLGGGLGGDKGESEKKRIH